MSEGFAIELARSSEAPVFHLRSADGEPVNVWEIEVRAVGSDEPSWRAVHDDGWLEDAVAMHILTPEEGQNAMEQRGLAGSHQGVVVERFAFGEIPPGMRQQGVLKALRNGWLYEITVEGSGAAARLQFQA